jgi:hypothetical protein
MTEEKETKNCGIIKKRMSEFIGVYFCAVFIILKKY